MTHINCLMQELNLPKHPLKFKDSEKGKQVFDQVRKKYILLTPEEWVRQNFINHLIFDLNFPKGLIKVEFGIQYNSLKKRPDILVYDKQGVPFLLIECKSFTEKLKHETLFQAATYNRVIQASYVVLTNGLEHICFTVNQKTGKIDFKEDFPVYQST